MTETLFQAASLFVLPFWLLMIAAPRASWTRRTMASPLPVAAPAVLYALLVLPRLGVLWPQVARPTLAGITALLGSAEGATIGWVHFLAFDLFVGRWIYLDSRERGISPRAAGPVLFLTLMFGPLGYLVYQGLRRLHTGGGARRDALRAVLRTVSGALASLSAVNRPLLVTGIAAGVALVGTVAGLLLDPRVVTGAPVWLKPAKFLLSVSIYSLTLVWLLGYVRGSRRWVSLAANVTAWGLVLELAIIGGQAARGTTSHFNMSTPLDGMLWSAMGIVITAVWLMGALAAWLLSRQQVDPPAFTTALRLGLLLTLVGMALGFLMTMPSAAQRATLAAGGHSASIGAHTVGAPDGGPGLPLVGWSTVGGDLRVGHFLGLHALQLLPLLGWALSRLRLRGLEEGDRVDLVRIAAAGYLALMLLVTWQALRGQPLTAPDGATLAALAACVAGVVAAVGAAWVRATVRAGKRM
ncbi:MAG TPA: ABA4-like family protein, partial [Armatimonadota bacterium]|nr:ABA4-like family protein [Armatimonadota bacterium]